MLNMKTNFENHFDKIKFNLISGFLAALSSSIVKEKFKFKIF